MLFDIGGDCFELVLLFSLFFKIVGLSICLLLLLGGLLLVVLG